MIEWKAIAIVGIWIGVGVAGLKSKDSAAVAFWAMMATVAVSMA